MRDCKWIFRLAEETVGRFKVGEKVRMSELGMIYLETDLDSFLVAKNFWCYELKYMKEKNLRPTSSTGVTSEQTCVSSL